MPTETAAGVIVFRQSPDHQREYLLLKSARGHWEFPKGHLEGDETWQQAGMRELHEEAGITDAVPIPGFARQIRYFFIDKHHRLVEKTVCFNAAETRSTAVEISDEHTQFQFLAFEPALRRLTHAGTRSLLRDLEMFLRQSDDWNQS